jgi:hypothetical protein
LFDSSSFNWLWHVVFTSRGHSLLKSTVYITLPAYGCGMEISSSGVKRSVSIACFLVFPWVQRLLYVSSPTILLQKHITLSMVPLQIPSDVTCDAASLWPTVDAGPTGNTPYDSQGPIWLHAYCQWSYSVPLTGIKNRTFAWTTLGSVHVFVYLFIYLFTYLFLVVYFPRWFQTTEQTELNGVVNRTQQIASVLLNTDCSPHIILVSIII